MPTTATPAGGQTRWESLADIMTTYTEADARALAQSTGVADRCASLKTTAGWKTAWAVMHGVKWEDGKVLSDAQKAALANAAGCLRKSSWKAVQGKCNPQGSLSKNPGAKARSTNAKARATLKVLADTAIAATRQTAKEEHAALTLDTA